VKAFGERASASQRALRACACLAASLAAFGAPLARAQSPRTPQSTAEAAPHTLPAPVARLAIEPREAQVGEPLRGRIELLLPRGLEWQAPALEAWLGQLGALYGPPRANALPQRAEPGAAELVLHTLDFEFTALEPGAHALPALELRWSPAADASGLSAGSLELSAGELRVTSALAPEEDAPRALRSASIEAQALPWWRTKIAASALSAAAAALVGLLVVGTGHWWVRRKARRATPAPPSALEQLAALESANASARWSTEHALAASHELARILRLGIDAQRGVAHPGASDEEWLALQPAAQRERLTPLCARLAAARFGGEVPSEWAWRECCAQVRALLAQDSGHTAEFAAASAGEERA
jgi:hypothetical protein